MELFIVWSDDRSKFVAESFSEWIPKVIQAVKPWMSTQIDRGANWIKEVSARVQKSRIGVVVLTPDNLKAPWVLFEAGALSKTISPSDKERVCTLLVGLDPGDVGMPLEQFQATPAKKESVWKLVQTINKTLKEPDQPLDQGLLETMFNTFWPELEKVFATALTMPGSAKPPRRSDKEILDEILERTRQQASALTSLDSRLQPIQGLVNINGTPYLGYNPAGIMWYQDDQQSNIVHLDTGLVPHRRTANPESEEKKPKEKDQQKPKP